jgi:hypothetical protein
MWRQNGSCQRTKYEPGSTWRPNPFKSLSAALKGGRIAAFVTSHIHLFITQGEVNQDSQ